MKYLPTILACFYINVSLAQVGITNGNQLLKIESGTVLYIQGNFSNNAMGTVVNAGEIKIAGNGTNTGTLTSPGKFSFVGTSSQTLDMNGASLDSILVSKIAAQVTLLSPLTIGTNLTFSGSNNYVALGINNLTFSPAATISGAGATNFIVTNDTGNVVQSVGNSAIVFPIGASSNFYTPFSISNSGTSDIFSVRVLDGVYTNYNNRGVPSGTALNQGREIQSSWIVNEQIAGGSNLIMIATWPVGKEGTNFDRNNSLLTNYSGGNWAGGTFSAATGANPYSQTMNNFTGNLAFTPFGVGGHPASPLPLSFIDFTATKRMSDALLNWTTANEVNLDYYEPERSIDGVKWSSLNHHIASTNLQVNSYADIDSGIFELDMAVQLIYYRIKIVEIDGTFTYSPIRTLGINKRNTFIQLYPNPSSGAGNLVSDRKLSYNLYDANGKLILSSSTNSKLHQFDLSQSAQGIYLVEITDESGISWHEKFILAR